MTIGLYVYVCAFMFEAVCVSSETNSAFVTRGKQFSIEIQNQNERKNDEKKEKHEVSS